VKTTAAPAEGITQAQELKLRSRKRNTRKNNSSPKTEFDKWIEMYKILFPNDEEDSIPSPCQCLLRYSFLSRLTFIDRDVQSDDQIRLLLIRRCLTDQSLTETQLGREVKELFCCSSLELSRAYGRNNSDRSKGPNTGRQTEAPSQSTVPVLNENPQENLEDIDMQRWNLLPPDTTFNIDELGEYSVPFAQYTDPNQGANSSFAFHGSTSDPPSSSNYAVENRGNNSTFPPQQHDGWL
jgi:hypothetical protein